jgi:hypothetical protein
MTTVNDIIDEINAVLNPKAEDKVLLCTKTNNETFENEKWRQEEIVSSLLKSTIGNDGQGIINHVILIGENIDILVATNDFLVFTVLLGDQKGISTRVFAKSSFTSYHTAIKENRADDIEYILNVANDRREGWSLKCTNKVLFYKAKDFLRNALAV